jgi:transposase
MYAVVTKKPATNKATRKAKTSQKLVVVEPLPMSRELLSAGVVLAEEIEIERQLRMEQLKAALLAMIADGKAVAAVDSVVTTMLAMEREADRLGWRVLKATRYRFGRSTERLSREEIKQLFLAFGGDATQAETSQELPVPAEEQPEQVADGVAADEKTAEASEETPDQPKKKRNRVKSMKVDPKVERIVTKVPVSAAERFCAVCNCEMVPFGHVDHELITFVPAKIVVHVEEREKLGCVKCRKDVATAPRTNTPSVKRKVDASLLAKLLNDKCALGLPLDRQRRDLARKGLEASDKTLQSYWNYTTDLLEPVSCAVSSDVFARSLIGADDSHLKTLDKSHKHGVFRGHIWCFVGTDGVVGELETVAYAYTKSWDATEVVDIFSSIDGFIQCDGYAGYSREIEDDDGGETRVVVPDERRLGCGMHIRSKFHDALLTKDRRAAIPIKYFADLYLIEEDCKKRQLSPDERLRERQQRSLPILDAFDDWVDTIHPKLLPKSPLRRATTYAINQREFFRRCFTDGRFEIDNGRTERRIRPYAVGRRGFLFTGSVRGGERLAVAYTLVDNCLILGINPHEYLVDIIARLESGWPMKRLSELTPANWLAQKTAQ